MEESLRYENSNPGSNMNFPSISKTNVQSTSREIRCLQRIATYELVYGAKAHSTQCNAGLYYS